MDAILKMGDGLTLQLRDWPYAGARGTVLILHGLGEHIGRYGHVAAHLNTWGWNVVGYDQRGHGASEGPRGQLASRDDLLFDLARVIDATRAAHPGPLVLLGHSMGGLVAARFVAEGVGSGPRTQPAPWQRQVDALVLSSPALDTGLRAGQKLLLGVLAPLAPNLAVGNGLKPAWISRDGAIVAAYSSDPRVHDRVAPRLARFIVDGGAFVLARASHWTLPTLLLYSGSDRCVAPAGSAAFAAAAPEQVVTTREFKPLFHEIFNEPEQAEVFVVLHDWLAARKP
jgi:alpha-beta hydrolase superfamily lysophospholipase